MLTVLLLQQMPRFRWNVLTDKKVIECQVSDGISKADELIEQSNQRGCT